MEKMYNDLRNEAFAIAKEHGFYADKVTFDYCLAHVTSELGEAYNAHRKGLFPDPHRMTRLCVKPKTIRDRVFRLKRKNDEELFFDAFNRCIKDTVADELADAVILLLSTAGYFNLDIDNAEHNNSYRRFFGKWTFGDNKTACERNLLDKRYDRARRIRFAIDYIGKWATSLGYDINMYVDLKMRYNKLRPMFNGKQY